MVPCVRLDDFELPACDLIKLDIEGAEVMALHGAMRTIDRHQPVVVIEQNGAAKTYGMPATAAEDVLKSLGYSRFGSVEFAAGNFDLVMIPSGKGNGHA